MGCLVAYFPFSWIINSAIKWHQTHWCHYEHFPQWCDWPLELLCQDSKKEILFHAESLQDKF